MFSKKAAVWPLLPSGNFSDIVIELRLLLCRFATKPVTIGIAPWGLLKQRQALVGTVSVLRSPYDDRLKSVFCRTKLSPTIAV